MALRRLSLSNLAYTVREFYLRDGSEEYRDKWNLDAPYQRGEVWTDEQKRNLIRSLLQGIPVGIIFANVLRDRKNPTRYARIVDGKQRITAIRDFVEDRLTVPAEWFEPEDIAPLGQIGTMVRYSGLSRQGRIGFDGSILATYESHLGTLEEEAELYLLVNFSGVPQTEEDRERAASIAAREGSSSDARGARPYPRLPLH